MSYKITCRVYQTNPNAFFTCVEKVVWNYANGGSWTMVDDLHVLKMGGSGTSGTMRFCDLKTGEAFTVTIGVHNYKRWCDIVTNLKPDETACIIQPQYYSGSHKDREAVRESQNMQHSVKNAKGRQIQVNYTQGEGNDMQCNLIIG